jgi:hypothetical protein
MSMGRGIVVTWWPPKNFFPKIMHWVFVLRDNDAGYRIHCER